MSDQEYQAETPTPVIDAHKCTPKTVFRDICAAVRQWWPTRPKYSYGAYMVVFMLTCVWSDYMALWSMDSDNRYDPGHGPLVAQIFNSAHARLSTNQGWMNLIIIVMVYIVLLTLINRFWAATAATFTLFAVYAVATVIKCVLRDEIILPSDLNFLTGGGEGDLMSFIPADLSSMIAPSVVMIVTFVLICVALQFLDGRSMFIHCSWRHALDSKRNIFGLICRIVAPILSIALLASYATGLGQQDSAVRRFLDYFEYTPQQFNTTSDANRNGVLTSFLSLVDVKAMEPDPNYSESAMQALNSKYAQSAQRINTERRATLTDSTVINVLSESYADPTRVPGVSFSEDPMPNLRSIMQSTTSGLALSPGYGGGTANIEFQQVTGLSMTNFAPSLATPYQQLIPNRPTFFSFNQMWNAACDGSTDCSVAFHPYYQNMYLRGANYTKFGFSHFHALNSKPQITHRESTSNSKYTSDEQAYANVLDELKQPDSRSKYIELITMQNHTPYTADEYPDNEFIAADTSTDVAASDRGSIRTYAKGVQITDKATSDFLEELDAIDRPITVVFYGDHLPGIYSKAMADPKNDIALHETDYFIWSNTASDAHTTKLDKANAAHTSSNYFMAQTAEHLNAKVSPYLALLTELHDEIPAMERLGRNDGEWKNDSSLTMLDAQGRPIDENDLSSKAKELLADYRSVQYDMCVGKNYLETMGFMELPKS